MTAATDPVFAALARAALDATGATRTALLCLDGDSLVAAAAAGERAAEVLGTNVSARVGGAAYVVESGQPLALAAASGDPRAGEGLNAALGEHPDSLLCVPCGSAETVLGALEVVGKRSGDGFSIDDVELVTLLGGIAGAAIAASGGKVGAAPPPADLAGELEHLADADPTRYAAVAEAVAALLARG